MTTKPALDYFFQQTRGMTPSPRFFSRKTLMDDLNRGVRRLPDYAYMTNAVSSHASIQFAMHLKSILGNSFEGKQAEMTYKNNNYMLKVITRSNHEVVFSGVGAGYFGEGSRTAYDILKLFGFSEEQRQKLWERENFKLYRRD